MAVTANSIITPQGPKSGHVSQAFTANTTITSVPTNTVLLLTAGASGSRLTRLRAWPVSTVTATQLQAFRSLDAGTTKKCFGLQVGSAYTYAATTAPTVVDFGYSDSNPMILGPSETVYVGAAVTGSWCFEAEWADY